MPPNAIRRFIVQMHRLRQEVDGDTFLEEVWDWLSKLDEANTATTVLSPAVVDAAELRWAGLPGVTAGSGAEHAVRAATPPKLPN